MARTRNRLTPTGVKNLKEPGLYADGGNLYLRVAPGGSRSWIFRFTLNGRTRDAGLGSYPALRLAEARDQADAFRKQLRDDIDPIAARSAHRAALKREAAQAITFEECATAYIAAHEAGWRNEKHRAQWRSTLVMYAFPIIGALPVKTVDTGLVMRVLEPIWMTKPETASRLRGRIEVILSWAKVHGYREGENPAQWRGHLNNLLPAKSKVRQVQHHAALPYSEVPALAQLLRIQSTPSARALEFLVLTAARTSEALGARWEEIDLQRKLWVISANRMKTGREHRVPLSSRATAIITEQSHFRRGDLVFGGAKLDQPLSSTAVAMLLRRLGHGDVTVHGFRSSFRDWAAECTAFPGEVAEMALAHAVPSAVEAAYRRGDLLQKRRELMAAWARFCDEDDAHVVRIHARDSR